MTDAFRLWAGSHPQASCEVLSFDGEERLSTPYSYEVSFVTEEDFAETHARAFAKPATLEVRSVEGNTRFLHGITRSLDFCGTHTDSSLREYRITLVPRLWLLSQGRHSRIFQDMSVREIVQAILAPHLIPFRWATPTQFPKRAYCLQYEESDLAFLQRILAESGLFYFFRHPKTLRDASLSGLTGDVTAQAMAALDSSNPVDAGLGLLDAALGVATGSGVPLAQEILVIGDDPSAYLPIPAGAYTEVSAPVAQITISSEASIKVAASVLPEGMADLAASLTSASAPALPVRREEAAQVHQEAVFRLALGYHIRPTTVELDQCHYGRPNRPYRGRYSVHPGTELLKAAQGVLETGSLSVSTAEAAVRAAVGASSIPLGPFRGAGVEASHPAITVFDHRAELQESTATDNLARVALEQHRSDALTGTARTNSPRLAPGYLFSVDGASAGLEGSYVVRSIRARGQAPHRSKTTASADADSMAYVNEIEFAPAYVACRPPRPEARTQQVLETATVVGPDRLEGAVFADVLGCIKVHFPWDRGNTQSEHTSCWIRTSQAWGGRSWGFQFVPRVGMEVLVGFLGGDVDQPIVLGSAYNATHPLPFSVTQSPTRSGIRTRSTHTRDGEAVSGFGHNELSFEDSYGAEQVYLRAERDFDEWVGHDHSRSVRRNENLHIEGNRTDRIEQNLVTTVGVNESRTILGNRESLVQGSDTYLVQGDRDTRVRGVLATRVEGRTRVQLESQLDLQCNDDVVTRVLGCMTTVVGKADRKRSWVTHAMGEAELSSVDRTQVTSETELLLKVGKSSIRITKDAIELQAPSVSLSGESAAMSASEDGLRVSSKEKIVLTAKEKVLLQTEKASVSLSKDVKLDGEKVLLRAPDTDKDPDGKEPPKPTRVELKDGSGAPLPHQRFIVVLSDGSEVGGLTDKEGKAELLLKESGTIVFPDLRDTRKS